MKQIILITMRWPDYHEPICAGTDREKVRKEALRLLREKRGTGPVTRHGAMCSLPIEESDLGEWVINYV